MGVNGEWRPPLPHVKNQTGSLLRTTETLTPILGGSMAVKTGSAVSFDDDQGFNIIVLVAISGAGGELYRHTGAAVTSGLPPRRASSL